MAGVRLTVICQALDESDPVLANHVRWVASLADHADVHRIVVLALRAGPADLPGNVEVRTFGASTRPGRLARFARRVVEVLRKGDADCFLVLQGGPYPALLLPVRLLLRRPVYQWKAHPHVGPAMRFYARCCLDLVLTSAPGSFPLDVPKRRVIGQGIDDLRFRPSDTAPDRDLVTVGRVAPSKRLDEVLAAVAACRDRHHRTLCLDVVGPVSPGDEGYLADLRARCSSLGITDQVRFVGPVLQAELPDLLVRYRAFLNFSATAFDKAAGEAMAAAIPVVTTNPVLGELLPAEVRSLLVASPGDVDAQAARLHAVAGLDDAGRRRVGSALREVVVRDHGLAAWAGRVMAEIVAERPSVRVGEAAR